MASLKPNPRCGDCGAKGRWLPISREWAHFTLTQDRDHPFRMPTPTEAEQDALARSHTESTRCPDCHFVGGHRYGCVSDVILN